MKNEKHQRNNSLIPFHLCKPSLYATYEYWLAQARLTKGAENVRRAKRRARRARLPTALVRGQFRAANLIPNVAPSERTPRSGGGNEGYLGTSRRLVQGAAVGSRGPVCAANRAPTLWIGERGSPKSWFKPLFWA